MDCPKCKNGSRIKDGIIRGRQRYRCKSCGYRYTVERKTDVKTQNTRRIALELHMEGIGFRSIGRLLKISYGTVYSWVKQWCASISLPRVSRENPCKIVSLEELCTYVESQKTSGRHGLLLIDLEREISLLASDSSLRQQRKNKNKL